MDFDYCEEYLTSISNNILPWQCLEKQIFIQLTFQIFWFFDRYNIFVDVRTVLFNCDWFFCVSIWLVALKVLFRMFYHLDYHNFVWVLYNFQHTTIISSLPDVLLYAIPNISSKISTHNYHFQRVIIEFLKKKLFLKNSQ